MSKLFKRIMLGTLSACLAACILAAGLIFGIGGLKNNNHGGLGGVDGTNNSGSLASGSPTSGLNTNYAHEIRLKGDNAAMTKQWNEAVSLSGEVYVVLENNWTAANNTDGFGKGDGFESADGGIIVPATKKITLDLNGKTIDRKGSAASNDDLYFFHVYGTLTVCDSSLTEGKITGGSIFGYGGAVLVESGGAFILNSGTITENYSGIKNTTNGDAMGGAVASVGGDITINGGYITRNNGNTSNTLYGGGGISVDGGTLTITGGEISENGASWGAGISVVNCTFNMSGGKITRNVINGAKPDAGGGIYVFYGCTVNISGGEISENEAAFGGAITVSVDSVLTMTGGKILNNTAYNFGGGIYIAGGRKVAGGTVFTATANISGVEISGNKIDDTKKVTTHSCDGYGGGIFVYSNCNVSISNSKITDNYSNDVGGGIGLGSGSNKSTLSINNTVITGNTAVGSGGGLYSDSGQSIGLSGGVIIDGNNGGNALLRGTAASNQTKFNVTGLLYDNGIVTSIGVASSLAISNKPVITTNYTKSGNTFDTFYFHADNNTQLVNSNNNTNPNNPEAILQAKSSISNAEVDPLDWEYQLDNDGTWISANNSGIVIREYDGKTVTGVRVLYKGTLINSTDGPVPDAGDGNKPKDFVRFVSSDGSTSFTGLKDVGSVGFSANGTATAMNSAWGPYYTFSIIVVPKGITVTADDKTSKYGETLKTLTSDASADLGVTLEKDYGYGVGKFAIRGKSWTNTNYDVTFVDGVYEITKLPVTVIINDTYAMYGEVDKSYKLSQTENNVPEQEDGASVQLKDENGDPLFEADGVTPLYKYSGGWRYGKKTDGTASEKFLSVDNTTTNRPFTLVCDDLTAIYDATNNSYLAEGDSYIIKVDAESLNRNYDITFVQDDGSTTGDLTSSTSKLKVEGAEISVLSATDYATKKGNGAKGYDGVEYDAKKHKIELPTDKFTGTDSKEYSAGAVQLKGDVGATDVKIHYIIFKNADAPKKDDADDKALMDPDNTGKWSSGVTAGTQTEKTDADTYVVYSRIEAKNHKTIVYKWTYKISAKTTAFRLEVYWNTTKIESTDGNAVIPDTDKAKAVYDGTTTATAKIEFVNADGTATGATATTCKTIFYYKNVSPKSDTDNSWKWGAWESTFTRADADQNSAKYKFSSDYNHHEEYGTTEKPKNGGTYTVTVVEDPRSSNGYNLATGGRSLSFTINAKEVEVPYNTDDFTYDGTEQKFGIDGFKKDYMQIVGDPTTSNGEATGLKYDTPNNFADGASGTDYKLVAKNAGEYKVTFGIKASAQDNYKWKTTKDDPENPGTEIDIEGFNADKTEYELTLTIKKVQLKATFTSPQKNIDSSKADAWTWAFEAYKGSKDENGKPNALISYILDETVIVNSESVSVNLRWAVKPATSGTELSPKTTGVIDNKTLNVDNAAFKKDTYYVYLDLPADNDVNKNYQTLVVDETTKLPSELNSNGTGACVQQFVIGDGNASVNGITWQWKDDGTAWNEYVKNSTDTTTKPNTELTYKLGTDKQAVAYTLQMDTSASGGFPTYFESENLTYTTTYSKTEKGTYLTALNTTDAGYYKTTVRLKIKSGETIKFVNASDKGYTYVDETQADYTFEWQIGKFKIDPNSTVEFGYKVKDKKTSQLSDFTKFSSVTENGEVIYEVGVQDGGNGIVVAVKLPTDLSAEPYDTSVILKVGTITGKGTVLTPETKQTADGVLLETTIPFSILSGAANNYELAKDADGNSLSVIKIKWRVVASTISAEDIVWSEPDAEDPTKYVDADGNPTTVSGEVDEIDADGNKTGKKITVTLPAPKLKAGDDKVKYVYVWTDDQGTEHRFEGLQGLYELTGISEREYNGGILPGTVTVKAEPQDGYRMDPSVPEASRETSVVIGDTKIRVRVTPEGELSGTYKEISVTFKVEELDASGNATEYDKELYKLWIYRNGNKDDKVEYSTEALKQLGSGKHTVAIELVNTIGYKIALGSEQFEITVKPVELEIPQLSENPIFNGKELSILSLLEANETYAAIKDLVTVTGQGSAENLLRNVGSYTLVIKINDTVNYVWKNDTTASATKYALTDGESVPESNRVSDEELNIAWEILPYRITVTDDMWKTGGKGGAVLNWAIPEGMLLELGYNYYETKTGGSALEKLSEGNSVWASAIITGEDVDNGNVVFADSGTNETLSRVAHTEPKSGLKAFANTAVDFVKKNWLWFAIGLGVLILLIILIIIIAVARKNKEKRLEKKAAKEEEKQRREEERRLKEEQREEEKRRREEEREAAKAKQEAELELAKARQEAELAKIKAQAAAAAAPAMAATAAMAQQAQQPQQMPQSQPTQQAQQPQQMPQAQQYQQPAMPQQMPQAQQYQQPVMPQQMQMPMMPQQGGGSDIERIISKLEAEFAKLRADQSRSYPQQLPAQGGMDVGTYMLMRLENDVQQLRNLGGGQLQGLPYMQNGYGLDGRGMNGVQGGMPVNGMNAGGDNAAAIAAAAAAAAIAAMNARQFKTGVEERKIIEAEASSPTGVDAPTVYPPDAVITTTTTVDTTKKQSVSGRFKRTEEDANAFDIDGFYESFQDK